MKQILPPTLFVICAVSMILLSWLWPVANLIDSPINWLGLAVLFIGLGISIWGSNKFTQVGTNIKTFAEPQKLVTDGLFRYSRNPIYLGFVLALAGVNIVLGTLSPVIGAIVFFVITDRWYIPFEERVLSAKFGQDFAYYKGKTRRWI